MKEVSLKNNSETLQKLYKGSGCTMLGYMPEELPLYINQLKENGFLKEDFTVYTCDGSDLNTEFKLEGQNKFPDDLHIFIIDPADMKDLGKFAISLRFQMGYRWLDDIINNSRPDEY